MEKRNYAALNEYGISKLRALRNMKGVSAHALAKQCGMCTDAYLRKERGDSRFFVNEIPAIIDALGMTSAQVNDIFFENKFPID